MMSLTTTVSIYLERGESEVELQCRVTHSGYGDNAEYELEWLGEEPTETELAAAEQTARDRFDDWAVEQPTDQDYADEAGDRAYKEMLEEPWRYES